ncbi:hypothetical protein B0H10DRAFT_2212458 [Mycena sp. CBHHK59/15]|nr:hypothetical protein B0H10DRAFT_2212458 [Mycena sp. CBHHK59/15]
MALGPVNNTGLAALPVETLLEITTHLKTVPVPCNISTHHFLSCVYLERLNALRALSETCKRLRSVFLEQAWRRLEAYASARGSDAYENTHYWHYRFSGRRSIFSTGREKELARALLWQAEVVTIRNPDLAQYVKFFPQSIEHTKYELMGYRRRRITLADWCADTVYAEFARCLSLLPNLETIQFCGCRTAYTRGGSAGILATLELLALQQFCPGTSPEPEGSKWTAYIL